MGERCDDDSLGYGRRLVRCRMYPSEEQTAKLREGIALCNRLLALLWAEGISASTKPLRVRCRGVVNRVLSDNEFSAVSVNPLDVMAYRVEWKVKHGAARPPRVKGLPFHRPIDRASPDRGVIHIPMVGDVPIEPRDVPGRVAKTYYLERSDGSWQAAFIMSNPPSRTPKRKVHRGAWRPISDRVLW